jgi:hypothetical protein
MDKFIQVNYHFIFPQEQIIRQSDKFFCKFPKYLYNACCKFWFRCKGETIENCC